MSFCTVVNCMDGRTQLPVITYMQERFDLPYVDSVTEPGPVMILSGDAAPELVSSILNRVRISVEQHGSRTVGVVAHADCTGNPATEEEQLLQLERSVAVVTEAFPDVRVLGLWVDECWTVHERFDVGNSGAA